MNALLDSDDSDDSESESLKVKADKPSIFSLENNPCNQVYRALSIIKIEKEQKSIELLKQVAFKKITSNQIKAECYESGF